MPKKPATQQQLLLELEELRAQLDEAKETLRAIRSSETDALMVLGVGGEQLFTLKGADQSYRTLIEDMSEGALTITAEGVILYANQRFAEIIKMPLEKVIGATIHTWIAPDSQRILQSLMRNDADEKRREQLDVIASDGTRVPVYLSVSKLLINGMPDSFCLVATDLTEHKHSEVIVASEKSARELLAAANQSRRALLSLIEDQKQAEEDVRKLNSDLEQKVIARTADLERTRLEAEQANQAKSDFLATMSHEIRTPMNGVIGMVDVLQQSSLNPQQMEMANIIHDSAYALLAVIDDILDFSKIEAGKLQIENLPMNIADVVEGVCDALDLMALKKAVELTLFVEPSLPAQVMGDPGRLRQILVNLTNNAIKFSSGQGRQARVSVRATRAVEGAPGKMPGKMTVEFCVTDNGIGIDAATQLRLFTSFTQGDPSTTRKFGGSGLGLAICRQLVDMKGGEIAVRSEPGKGSMFSVRLPFELPTEKLEAVEQPSPVAGLCCLIVGGADSLAKDMAAYLTYDGAVVERVTDMVAARQWIASQPPGLRIVIIDNTGVPSPLDELRTAARAQTGPAVRFVIIRRGKRRECRVETADQISLDAEVMHRKAFLEAVAIAAGRIKKQDLSGQPGRAREAPAPLSREEARQRGSLILIAEDNEINQKVILQQLKLFGQTADVASNGREALELWQSGDYSMLITDLHMPEKDGYQLTAAIRASESVAGETGKPRAPIIAFTANALKGEAEHCRAVGMDDYLSKPVQLVDLKAMLKKWLPVAANPLPQSLPHREREGKPFSGWEGGETNGTTSHSTRLPRDGSQVAGYVANCENVNNEPPIQPVAATVPVDVNVLKALVGDDEATIRDFLKDFRISAEKIAAELRTACAAGNTAAVAAAAHKLKSSARSVGALALGELCAEMEQAGKAGQAAELAALLFRYEAEMSTVGSYLDSL